MVLAFTVHERGICFTGYIDMHVVCAHSLCAGEIVLNLVLCLQDGNQRAAANAKHRLVCVMQFDVQTKANTVAMQQGTRVMSIDNFVTRVGKPILIGSNPILTLAASWCLGQPNENPKKRLLN